MALVYFNLAGSWLVDGGGEAEGAEVESNNGRRRWSCNSADKGINKRLVSVLDNESRWHQVERGL